MFKPVQRLPGVRHADGLWVGLVGLFTTSFREYGLLGPADWLEFAKYTLFLKKSETTPTSPTRRVLRGPGVEGHLALVVVVVLPGRRRTVLPRDGPNLPEAPRLRRSLHGN
jgi:hypothetical protein